MKDFYDIYYLSGLFDFDGSVLLDAVKGTLRHRNRELPEDAFSDINDFRNNEFLLAQWRAFEPVKEMELPFTDALERLIAFLEPIYMSILTETTFVKRWSCDSKQWL